MKVPSFRPVSSTWGTRRHLRGYAKNLTGYVKFKKNNINTDSSVLDLGLATGDQFVRIFD
jgi:hypothetical protein